MKQKEDITSGLLLSILAALIVVVDTTLLPDDKEFKTLMLQLQNLKLKHFKSSPLIDWGDSVKSNPDFPNVYNFGV